MPRFGLYFVDYDTYARIPTEGARVLGAIAQSHTLTAAQRARHGGEGSMTAEPGVPANAPLCTKAALAAAG